MVVSMLSGIAALIAQAPTTQELADKLTLDSQILGEQFYYWTVVIMWLIHVGFMSYEAGAGRRKNVMATAMKNILTIAVVTPTFYYFGWWIYGCFNTGIIPFSPGDFLNSAGEALPGTSSSEALMANFCSTTYPWAANLGPNLTDHISGVFWAAFLLFSWTTASILSGALIERVRLSAYLVLGSILGSVIWILDAAWGWSAFGFLNMRYGFHDSIAGLVVHGVAGAFTLGVLLNLGPRIGKYTRDGLARSFRPHNLHLTLMGLMLIFTGFYRVLRGLPGHPIDVAAWVGEHLPQPDDPLLDHVRDHDRLRRRLHRRLLREPRRPVLDTVRRPRRRHLGLGRRGYLCADDRCTSSPYSAARWPSTRAASSRTSSGSTTRSARWRCTACAASGARSPSVSSRPGTRPA